ncbi:MAG: ABC transporter ATP-binding protein [Desulfobacteraceae bacterium]|nr:MAG: ABC transporter ATP-binding protein [Desulfobacteraceae bacterium]
MTGVRLEKVSKFYGSKPAVREVSLSCREGEFLSIIGPTGAGKSTILKMLAGIEKVSSGKIYFDDQVVNDLLPRDRNVSMAFETYNLYPHMKVYDNIAFPLRAPRWGLRLTRRQERERVGEIAGFLGIDELLERLPQHLSGGQKQRVSLARALIRRPRVYLLDEPIAHLDARLKFSTQSLLKEFASKYRSTIIYVTHDYREALGLSDRIVVLRRGAIEQEGTPEEVYHAPATDYVGSLIGEPPMNLIDGEVTTRDGKAFFKAGENFLLEIRADKIRPMQEVSRHENGCTLSRLGIRCEHIALGREKLSGCSVRLPVYAVAQGAESSIVTFDLKNCFLHVRFRCERGVCDYRLSEDLWLDFDQNRMFFFRNTVDVSRV